MSIFRFPGYFLFSSTLISSPTSHASFREPTTSNPFCLSSTRTSVSFRFDFNFLSRVLRSMTSPASKSSGRALLNWFTMFTTSIVFTFAPICMRSSLPYRLTFSFVCASSSQVTFFIMCNEVPCSLRALRATFICAMSLEQIIGRNFILRDKPGSSIDNVAHV